MTAATPTIGLPEVLNLAETVAESVLTDYLVQRTINPDNMRALAGVAKVFRAHKIPFPPLLDRALKMAVDAGGNKLFEHWDREYIVSSEFQDFHASLGEQAYVEMLYEKLLRRPADTTGLQHWLQAMNDGSMDRAAVAGCIVETIEFRDRPRRS